MSSSQSHSESSTLPPEHQAYLDQLYVENARLMREAGVQIIHYSVCQLLQASFPDDLV
jgi:hypothetical protein